MKPRARWFASFTSWFFNTSPEWVEKKQVEDASDEPPNPPKNGSSEEAPDDARDATQMRGPR